MERTIELEGATLRCLDAGSPRAPGKTVLFCHGNSGGADAFAGLVGDVARRGWRGLACDFWGHGGSALPDGDACTVSGYVRFIAGVLAATGTQRCLLVGHSLGGHAALEAMGQLGERVRGVVCLGAPPFNRATVGRVFRDPVAGLIFRDRLTRDEAERVAAALVQRERVSADVFAGVMARLLATREGVRGRIGRALAEGDFADEVALCRDGHAALAFIQGEADPFIAADYFDELPTTIGRAVDIHRLAGVGHSPHLEAPDMVREIVAQLAAQVLA